MSKQMKMLVVVIPIFLGLVLYNVIFFVKKGKRPAVAPRPTASARKSPTPSRIREAKPDVPDVRYVSFPSIREGVMRDPFLLELEAERGLPWSKFRKEVTEEDERPDDEAVRRQLAAHQLLGILYDPKEPLAIIDDRITRIGDSVGNVFKLSEIRRDRVVLLADGRNYELTLPRGQSDE